MLGENIASLRKSRGMSQEALADRVHVVRQTVSKWEKGLSVPDAAMLSDLAEALGVTVQDLLGGGVEPDPGRDRVAEQLSLLNEQLAEEIRRRRRSFRVVLGVLLCIVLVPMVLTFLGSCMFAVAPSGTGTTQVESLVIEKDGQTYGYSIGFDGKHRLVWQSGDSWVVDIAESIGSNDAEAIVDQLVHTLRDMGATVNPA